MRRRNFLAASLALASWRETRSLGDTPAEGSRFHPCLNQVTTLGAPFEGECEAYASAGFRKIELWLAKFRSLPLSAQQITATLSRWGLDPVSSCGTCSLLDPVYGSLESHLPDFEKTLGFVQALGIPRHVVCSTVRAQVSGDDYKIASERLYQISELASKYKVKIALEFIARSDFVGSLPTAISLIRTTGHPNVGLLLDTFHFFVGVSKTEDLHLLRPGEVEHVHFHDVPDKVFRERLTDKYRLPPGEGIIPLKVITAELRRIGYSGSLSTELFGSSFQDGDPKAVALRCYKALLPFC